MSYEGILLVNKPSGLSSFALVAKARKKFNVRKIGHGGTLDPFATGLVVLLVGRSYTTRASEFLQGDKEYRATVKLGLATDSYDLTGKGVASSDHIPSLSDVENVLKKFQGTITQVPPMYSAKKVGGKRLYKLARKGVEVERKPSSVCVSSTLISYEYPYIELLFSVSKGTYIRSLAHDIGVLLGSYAHLQALCRTRSSDLLLSNACDAAWLDDPQVDMAQYFICK